MKTKDDNWWNIDDFGYFDQQVSFTNIEDNIDELPRKINFIEK